MKVCSGLLDPSVVHELYAQPEVELARGRLATSNKVYFDMTVPASVKSSLQNWFGLNLSAVNRLPFRWIRGDTPEHVDFGRSSFKNTYLVYLTDSEGEFHIDDASYPIEAGTAFSFSEGSRHSVLNTQGTERLLLGPMSETGFPVGAPISADGATETIYLRDEPGTGVHQYKINDGDWNTIPFPMYIVNTNGTPSSNILKIIFTTNMELTGAGDYFIPQSNGIQIGSTTLLEGGSPPIITLIDITDWLGLIQNGSDGSNGYGYVYVINLVIVVTGTTTLSQNAGWFGQTYYGYFADPCVFTYCSVAGGTITANSGGIVGSYAGYAGVLSIRGCIVSPTAIQTYGGGITGSHAADDTSEFTITGCRCTGGTIGLSAGGIVGAYSGDGTSTVTISNCYSDGDISIGGGGIAGQNASNITIANCYSEGDISLTGGGIVGASANAVLVSNCYSTGAIAANAGGIFGGPRTSSSAVNCYTSGSRSGSTGGIYTVDGTDGLNNFSEANNGNSGTWSSSQANTVLQGEPTNKYGTTWSSPTPNTPYKLTAIGYTWYSLTNISVPGYTLITSSVQTVQAGNTTLPTVNPFGTYSILDIYDSDPGTLTMDDTTGVVTVGSTTPAGSYTIYVYAESAGLYLISSINLTVTGAPAPPTPSTNQLPTPIGFKRLNYSQFNALRRGDRLVLERLTDPNIRFTSYADYLKYKIARATINTK